MQQTKVQLSYVHALFLTFLIAASYGNAEHYDAKLDLSLGAKSLSRIAPILGESAIVDRESGRVFWQGGKQSLFDSVVGHSYLSIQQEGILRHVRATIFSCILWVSFVRFLAEWALKQKILTRLTETLTLTSQRVLDVIKILTRAALFCLVCLPKFGKEFILLVGIMYCLESYTCSTRKYLDNTLSCPDEVETLMEGLREEEPLVSWKIRCYHYQKRKLLRLLLLIDVWNYFDGVFRGKNADEEGTNSSLKGKDEVLGPSILTKKVVTCQMQDVYQVRSWEDETIGGIWKQAQAATTNMAAFTKISLHKLLLFTDKAARIDYFQQQSDFITREGKHDVYAEFSTHVDVKGYREKVLAVRPRKGFQNLFDIRYFWVFTFMGLTVPYRIRFGRHCDELRVAIVKETSADQKVMNNSTERKSSWLSTPRSWFRGSDDTVSDTIEGDRRERFRKHMRQISLYHGESIGETDKLVKSSHEFDEHKKIENDTMKEEIQCNIVKGKGKATQSTGSDNVVVECSSDDTMDLEQNPQDPTSKKE